MYVRVDTIELQVKIKHRFERHNETPEETNTTQLPLPIHHCSHFYTDYDTLNYSKNKDDVTKLLQNTAHRCKPGYFGEFSAF